MIHRLSLFVAILLIASTSSAQLQGDPALLKVVAKAYRDNLSMLKTWRGEIKYSDLHKDSDPKFPKDWLTECDINFACEPNGGRSGKYRYDIRVQDHKNVDGQWKQRLKPYRTTAIFNGQSYFESVFRNDPAERRRVVVIRPEPDMEPGFVYAGFVPLFFFIDQGTWLDDYLDSLHAGANELLDTKLVRTGDVVTLTHGGAASGLTVDYMFDLAQGGNLLKVLTIETAPEYADRSTVSWQWIKVSGVWVPAQAKSIRVTVQGTVTTESDLVLDWSKHVVNDQLPADEFSWKALGMRIGDRVQDALTHNELDLQNVNALVAPIDNH
jgi:hypothetical protein